MSNESLSTFFALMNKTISFELHAVGVLKNNYDNVMVTGVIDASHADRYGTDVYALHSQVYRQIPEGTMADDADSYKYIIVKHPNGQEEVLGIPWINHDSILTHNQINAVFTVANIAQEDINRIADVIKRYGYHVKLEIK